MCRGFEFPTCAASLVAAGGYWPRMKLRTRRLKPCKLSVNIELCAPYVYLNGRNVARMIILFFYMFVIIPT